MVIKNLENKIRLVGIICTAFLVGCVIISLSSMYPPGIPLLAPGERVTREIIRQLQEAGTRERFGVEGEYLRCANV